MSQLLVVGMGPGEQRWCTPGAFQALRNATDLIGYSKYTDQALAILANHAASGLTVHSSDNRVEADRSILALDLASEPARRVVVVSSGDAGVFGMATAILEQLEQFPGRWDNVDVQVEPGITAAQAVAASVGAPLGHDFCVMSLSDVRKPWEVIEQRLTGAALADFVIAIYNPRSLHRPHQFGQALEILRRYRAPDTVVILGRNIGRTDASTTITSLEDIDVDLVDMRTCVIVGSSATRAVHHAARTLVFTPRTIDPVSTGTTHNESTQTRTS